MRKKCAQHLAVMAAASAFLVLGVGSAHAGFQWMPAVEKVQNEKSESVSVDDVVMPMPGKDDKTSSSIGDGAETDTVIEEQLPEKDVDTSETAEIVSGYGQDLPLIIALRQIVPADYQFSFEEGVDLSARVSWEGGRPWVEVLSDVTDSAGLRAEIKGSIVAVGRAQVEKSTDVMMAKEMAEEPVLLDAVDISEEAGELDGSAAVDREMAPMDASGPSHEISEGATASADIEAASWTGHRGDLLRDLLENWSERAGVELFWSSEYNYALEEDFVASGSYEDAVRGVLDVFKDANPRPYGRLHEGSSDVPPVLVVETQ